MSRGSDALIASTSSRSQNDNGFNGADSLASLAFLTNTKTVHPPCINNFERVMSMKRADDGDQVSQNTSYVDSRNAADSGVVTTLNGLVIGDPGLGRRSCVLSTSQDTGSLLHPQSSRGGFNRLATDRRPPFCLDVLPSGPEARSITPHRPEVLKCFESGLRIQELPKTVPTSRAFAVSPWLADLRTWRKIDNPVPVNKAYNDESKQASGSSTQFLDSSKLILNPNAAAYQPITSSSPKMASTSIQADLTIKSPQPTTIKRTTHRPSHKPFRPMNKVLHSGSPEKPPTQEERIVRIQNGISPNYKGNPLNPNNHSANIPDSENCSLFLTNLPAQCSYQDLLRAVAVHRPGRIWSTYINPPRDPKQDLTHWHSHSLLSPVYRTSAAKVIFYHPAEAQRLMDVAMRGGLRVRGHQPTVVWNRHRTAAQGPVQEGTSRVLRIAGPASLVSEERLRGLFGQFFEYESEDVFVVHGSAAPVASDKDEARERQNRDEVVGRWGNIDWCVLEWRFASMRAQAHSAYRVLRSLYPDVVDVQYVADPCAGYLVMDGKQAALV